MARFLNLLPFFALFLLLACQPDQPTNTAPEPLPEVAADYEDNPYPWGFIDSTGNLVIRARYDEVRAFSEGLALVRSKGRWGYINRTGQPAIPTTFRAAWPFTNGRARTQTDEGKFGFIDRDGNWIITAEYDELSEFSEDLAAFRQGENYGYISTTGAVIIEPQFSKAGPFANGQAIVAKDGQYGIISSTGETVIDFYYDRLKPFSGALARARVEGLYGYLDATGELIIEPAYRQASDFVNGVAAVAKANKWGLIDGKGESIMEPIYDQLFSAGEERWIAALGSEYYLLDNNGDRVINRPFQEIQPFSDGLAAYQLDELWGYLLPDGSTMGVPQYYLAWPFKNGIARVATRFGLGFINTKGNLLFRPRPQFFELRDFSEGLAPAEIH